MRYSLVTVVFDGDIGLLELQGISVAKFFPFDLMDKIIILDNSKSGGASSRIGEIRRWYGAFSDKVEVIPASVILKRSFADGWRSQQVLKLAVSLHIEADRYLVLDAKSHLIWPLTVDFLQDATGKPNINCHSFDEHPLRKSLENATHYLKLPPSNYIANFPATVPPFLMVTSEVRQLIRYVETTSARSLDWEFFYNELTEFFLYSAWIIKRYGAVESIYNISQNYCETVWDYDTSEESVRSKIRKASLSRNPFFAVHRRATLRMSEEARGALSELWTQRGLFPTRVKSEEFLMRYINFYSAYERSENKSKTISTFAFFPFKLMRKINKILNGD